MEWVGEAEGMEKEGSKEGEEELRSCTPVSWPRLLSIDSVVVVREEDDDSRTEESLKRGEDSEVTDSRSDSSPLKRVVGGKGVSEVDSGLVE